MFNDRKKQALTDWLKLLAQPEIRMDAEEQYDELLKMADLMEQEGLIIGPEWRQMIRNAGVVFPQAREGLEGRT
ncbi:hypothetical protein [Pseudomonas serbica]|jgi:hypothetical protein|uniref:hypothetical protein n=1 Tax=Pseudomonas serbica TaxID=2965074 RepID=UPI00237BC791|nr:hypothetical protein [Pseudomonas serbica]